MDYRIKSGNDEGGGGMTKGGRNDEGGGGMAAPAEIAVSDNPKERMGAQFCKGLRRGCVSREPRRGRFRN